jgi:hypothetical protein
MANGLRKLIKRARKQITNDSNRRFNRFGNRLKVEELEERIAPAAGLTATGAGVVDTNTVTLSADGDTAVMENAAGDIWTFALSSAGITAGDVKLTFDSAAAPTDVTIMDFGNGAGLTGAADAEITLTLTNDVGSAAMTVDTVVDTNTNTSTTSFVGADADTADLITVGTVALNTSTIETWNTGAIASLTTIGVDTSMRVGAVGATGITTTSDFLGTLTVTGSLAGPVTSALTIGATTLEAGSTTAGDITATTGNIAAITLGDAAGDDTLVFAGDIVSTAGSIASISGTDETSITISGAVTAGTSVGTIGTHIQDVSGTITAGTTVGAITVLNDLSSTITGTSVGAIDATNDFAGAITASTTTVGNVTVGNDLTGDITAETTIGDIAVTNGSLTAASAILAGTNVGSITVDADESGDAESLAGSITATAGSIGAVTVGGGTGAEGDLTGSLTAGTSIGAITVGNDIGSAAAIDATTVVGNVLVNNDLAGDITAGTAIGTITVTDGTLAATSAILAGTNIGNVAVDADESGDTESLAGTLTATAGTIGTVDVGGDISGAVSAGTTIGAITSNGSLSSAMTAGTDFTGAILFDTGIAAGGSLVATTGNFDSTITITAGGMAGAITATDGDIDDAVTITDGGMAGAITAGTNIDGDITISDDGLAGTITATAGDINGAIAITDELSGSITATAGNISGGITISDATDGTLSGTIEATAGSIDTTGITIANGITATGAITVGTSITAAAPIVITDGGLVGTITAGTSVLAAITVTDGGVADTASITAGTDVSGTITVTDGDFAGDITATAGAIGNVTLGTGNSGSITIDASFTSGTTMGTLTADGDFAAAVSAGGAIGGIISLDGDITADSVIIAGGTIGQVSADVDETSSGVIAAAISTTVGNITAIDAGGNITGTLTAFAQIGTIETDGELSGTITAGTGITGAVQIDDGITADGSLLSTTGNIAGAITIDTVGMAGTIKADAGDIDGAVTITAGGLSGTIEAGTDIDGAITVTAGGVSGTIQAGTNIDGLVTISAGGLTATGIVQASNGNIGGGLTVTAGGIDAAATVSAGADIDGNITATTGDIAAPITAATNIDGDINAAAGAITGTVTATAGDLTGNVTAGTGDISSIVVGGEIDGSTIRAEDNITSIVVTGDLAATVTASYNDIDGIGNIGTVTSGGGIDVTMAAIDIGTVRSGGLTGEDIEGTITAEGDINLIDAGDAIIEATVTAGTATSASPLATFISGGYSYAVWAFETGTTTVDTGVTAQIVFDGTGSPDTMTITKLDDSTPATTPDIYITTRVDTGVEQVFADTDVDVDAAPVNVTLGADAAFAINTLTVEGNYTLGSDTDITATTIVVEGGVSGTVAVPITDDITFGSITGDLEINVDGQGMAGSLILTEGILAGATVTVSGSLAGVTLGDASINKAGSLGNGASILTTVASAGTIGDISVNGSVNGSITATSIGDILIAGNLANDIDVDTNITASTGDIGNIEVGGTIGADVAQALSIQSTAGSVGSVVAGGDIGAGDGTTSIVANTNVGDVVSTVGTIGDLATAVTITATNGTVSTVSAVGDDGDDVGINVDLTAGGNITAVTALDPDEANGGIMGTITSNSGNIGTVSTIDADIAATITATLGNVDNVIVNPDGVTLIPDTGDVTGAITAGGDIDAVTGNDITSTIISKAATAASPVTVFTYNNIAYTFDATSGPSYSYTFNGAAKTIDITVDNATAQAADVDIALTTDVATGGSAGNVDDAPFDLLSLDFTAASATGDFDNLGTLAVEGDVDGQIVTGTINALLVEGDVELPVLASKTAADNAVTAVAVGSALGVDDPTAAGLQSMFDDPDVGDSVIFGAPADPSVFTVTAGSPTSAGGDVSFTFGTTGAVLNSVMTVLGTGIADTAAEYQVTVSGDAITSIEGYTTTDGSVTIDGDLAYMMTAWDLDTVTITGNILATGGINAKDIGNIVVGTAADSFSTYGDAAAAQAALDLTGDMAGTITSSEVIANSVVVMDGNILAVTILGDLTGTITADGSVGAVSIGQSVANLNGTKVAQTGLMSGTLVVGNDLASLTTELSQSGNVIVTDESGSIVSTEGDVGGVVMVGDSLTTITAGSGNVTADIFIGGDAGGADNVAITGLSITGNLMIGATNGVDELTLTLKADATDANPVVYTIGDDAGDGMLVEIENDVNPVSVNGVTVDSITMIETGGLILSVNNDASIDLDELYLLSDADINFSVEGDVGLIVAADDIGAPTSAELDAEFNATYSVVNAPTALDAVLSDGGNDVSLAIDIDADNVTRGVIASGNLDVDTDANVGTFGYMLSLNGTVTADIDANDSIGSIAASGDIDATLETEGVIAVDDAGDMQTDVVELGLSGLPSWFAGGVLSEIGDVDIDATADGISGSSTIMGIPVGGSGSEYAMGTVYAMLGEVSGTYDLGAGFGGIVAPMDDLNAGSTPTVNVPLNYQIDMFVAPYTNGGTVGGTMHPTPQLNLVDGEVLVSANNPYESGNDKVEVFGSGVLAYVDGSDVTVIAGLNDAAAEVNIEGDVSVLTVDTDWAGTISVMENADGDNGEITGWLVVNGDVDADTADLVAYNFAGYTHSGDVTGTSPVDANQFVEEGVLDWSNNSVSWTNLAGDDQTLYMWGSYTVDAEYETFFGKLNSVDIVGQGVARLASVNAASASGILTTMGNAIGGQIPTDGTAHVGDITSNSYGSNVFLYSTLVDGTMEDLNVSGYLFNLAVSGSAGSVEASRMINNAFINGNVSSLNSDWIMGTTVNGSVSDFDAIYAFNTFISGGVSQMAANMMIGVAVDGTVSSLLMGGGANGGPAYGGAAYGGGGWGIPGYLINCRFGWISSDNIDNRPWIQEADPNSEGSDAVQFNMNDHYNPVYVINTSAPNIDLFS